MSSSRGGSHVHDAGSEARAEVGRRFEAGGHLALELHEADARRNARAEPLRAPGRDPVAGGCHTRHAREQQRAIGQRSRHRPRVVQALGERDDARGGHEPARGLDRGCAAQRRRDPERSSGVGAGGGGHHRGGQGRAGAAARPARGAVERPRAAHLVGGAARGELVRVEVPDEHHAALLESESRRHSSAPAPRPAGCSTR